MSKHDVTNFMAHHHGELSFCFYKMKKSQVNKYIATPDGKSIEIGFFDNMKMIVKKFIVRESIYNFLSKGIQIIYKFFIIEHGHFFFNLRCKLRCNFSILGNRIDI